MMHCSVLQFTRANMLAIILACLQKNKNIFPIEKWELSIIIFTYFEPKRLGKDAFVNNLVLLHRITIEENY